MLDPSQREAMRVALSKRVALIQGPPGTGKTHVGAMVCDAIARRSKETILCVCYTNHALDQFLESLLDKGITDIVRTNKQRLYCWALLLYCRNVMPLMTCTSSLAFLHWIAVLPCVGVPQYLLTHLINVCALSTALKRMFFCCCSLLLPWGCMNHLSQTGGSHESGAA